MYIEISPFHAQLCVQTTFSYEKDIEIDQRSLNKLYFVLRIDKPSYSNDKSVVHNGNR